MGRAREAGGSARINTQILCRRPGEGRDPLLRFCKFSSDGNVLQTFILRAAGAWTPACAGATIGEAGTGILAQPRERNLQTDRNEAYRLVSLSAQPHRTVLHAQSRKRKPFAFKDSRCFRCSSRKFTASGSSFSAEILGFRCLEDRKNSEIARCSPLFM